MEDHDGRFLRPDQSPMVKLKDIASGLECLAKTLIDYGDRESVGVRGDIIVDVARCAMMGLRAAILTDTGGCTSLLY